MNALPHIFSACRPHWPRVRTAWLAAVAPLALAVAVGAVPAAVHAQSGAAADLALSAPLPQSARVAPQAIQDDRGRTVLLAQPPVRIVSLLPSLTESVCAMRLCDRLVGVDRYSDWPAALKKLPNVGGGIDPNIEAIVALKPDLVLMSHASKVADRLEALGIKVAALEVRSQAGVHKVLGTLDKLLGVPPAQGSERVWGDLQSGLAQAAAKMPPYTKGQRAYFEVSRGPYAAGPQSFIGEIMTQLGVGNVVSAELGPFPKLSPEFILRAQPDVILMSSRSMQVATSAPGWNSLKAVQGKHLCVFDEQESNIIVRPGPRMAEAAMLMANCLAEKAPRSPNANAASAGGGAR